MATLNLKEMKWIDENALRIIISTGLGFASRIQTLENKEIEEFTPDKLYEKGSKVLYNDYLWVAKVTNQSATFNENFWTLIGDDITELTLDDIKAFLGLTQEQLNTLASIIVDTEIRLDKTWSSSKTYSDIQDAIKECKQYCVTELAKKSTGSFKKANSTSEVTDGNYLYLILNSSTNKYDIYALVDSNVELLTSVDVNLDDYYTKTEINNDFLKKTDATSTYATKTEVNDKVDKTSILSATSSTATDDILYSAKLVNSELDKKIDKSDITTTIDSTSTDDTVPSAKSVEARVSKREKIKNVDLDTFVNEGKYYIQNGCTNSPIDGGYLNVMRYDDNFVCQICVRYDTNGSEDMHIRTKVSGRWLEWNKVCTTGVNDVAKTTITFSDVTNYKNADNGNAFSYYYVQDGICYLSIYLECVSPVNTSTRVECMSDIPKPKTSIRKIVTPWTLTNYNVAPIFFCLENNSQSAFIMGGNVGIKYLLQFSYPVAES